MPSSINSANSVRSLSLSHAASAATRLSARRQGANLSRSAIGSYHDLELRVAQVGQLLPHGMAVDDDVIVVDDDRRHLAETLQECS